jgi:hypothetical protein
VTATISASAMRYLAIMIAPFCLPEGIAAECRKPTWFAAALYKDRQNRHPHTFVWFRGLFLPQAFYAGAASP